MFTIEMLPAQRGDCLWLTYGTDTDPHHILIDVGPRNVRKELIPTLEHRLHSLPGGTDRVELLVITHIDTDHIEGAIPLLTGAGNRLSLFRQVWFNGYQHLAPGILGAKQGEMLTAALLTEPARWNTSLSGKAIARPDTGPLTRVELPGDLSLIVLAPGTTALKNLRKDWEKECEKAGIVAGHGTTPPASLHGNTQVLGGSLNIKKLAATPFTDDTSKPNASSICLLAVYQGKTLLLLGDATAAETTEGLQRLATHGSVLADSGQPQPAPTGARQSTDRHHIDAVKVAHHGSRNNTSLPLLALIESPTWLISSNGANYEHPDSEAVARIITTQHKPTLVFNYHSDYTQPWIAEAQDPLARFHARYPTADTPGITHNIA